MAVMTFIVVTLLGVLAILAATITGLLVQRARRSRTECALRERYERLRLIVEQTPAMVWTMRTSPNGRTPRIGFARSRRHWR